MSISIEEIKNDKIKIKAIKMATNSPIPGNEGRVFERYGFSLLVVGPPGSGKSSLVFSQLTNPGGLFYRKFNKVYIFSPSLHTIEKDINIPDDQKIDSFDLERLQEIIDNQKQSVEEPAEVLLIFDDLMAEITKDSSKTFLKMIMNRRHLHLSVICMSQVFNKIKSHIRKGFSDVIILKTNNKKEIETVRDELSDLTKDEFKQLIHFCFDSNHSFVMFRNTGEIFHNFNLLKIVGT